MFRELQASGFDPVERRVRRCIIVRGDMAQDVDQVVFRTGGAGDLRHAAVPGRYELAPVEWD